jgi:hypothetical protein
LLPRNSFGRGASSARFLSRFGLASAQSNRNEEAAADEFLSLFSTFPFVRSSSRNDAKQSPFLISLPIRLFKLWPQQWGRFFWEHRFPANGRTGPQYPLGRPVDASSSRRISFLFAHQQERALGEVNR